MVTGGVSSPSEERPGPGGASMRWTGPAGYWASDDRSLVDVDRVHRWLSEESYWAQGRSRELVA
jgi:hypothetical protein